MQHALAEAAGVDNTFFDTISAGIEEEKDYKEIFAAVERHYEKGKMAKVVTATMTMLSFMADKETDPTARLTKFEKALSAARGAGYKPDGFIQLMIIFTCRLLKDDQEAVWKAVQDKELPILEDTKKEIEAIGTARAIQKAEKGDSTEKEGYQEFEARAEKGRSHKREVNFQSSSSSSCLEEKLEYTYKEKHERRKARKQVLSLRCTGTVDDYNKEFSLLALKITNASEEDLVEDYIEGLPPGIMYETDRMEPATLDAAMEKALDSEIWLKQASSHS
uniref:Retrotransposon gag domain-containing protein n=1 Tax=Chromera velia CCMP2878 TaxID=1169474 RepID=A0A0G4I7P7_9ALVE|eukprot:Cvel_11657.t1-p1 / transcript=Cvel_11657.t1 / gene=Cvel_11657 / organism=Chromera_velia_CCMP2878 / gene_product=hypothetical protein / transcript_product=hypothetical protein / location=Cvel_scaffold739:9063-10644(-) / protein_length=276 / sequence_SO=supercontig / SO=protein_coding / is_pseudo=false